MGSQRFSERAEEARRAQWRLNDLPWDERIRLAGDSRRERLLAKLDLLGACEALYHLKLGARSRAGTLYFHTWKQDDPIIECLEWLDTDELRHLRTLRRLIQTVHSSEQEDIEAKPHADPTRMWRVGRNPRGGPSSLEAEELRALVDEATTRCLLSTISRQSRVPIVRAAFSSCARDDGRHIAFLSDLAKLSLNHDDTMHVVRMQGVVLRHIARIQSSLRPYFRVFAAVTDATIDNVASEVFRAVSAVVADLGTPWVRYPTARVIHEADRSPWMLWLLR
ncbi:MAG TPA: hypothetical protein PLJ27_05655 [Polyangiaceae bacterium]|nr:hypothetical protein [Polyangiaceae bacterium]